MSPRKIDLDSTKGKTIKRVFAEYCEQVLIVFEDQTFCVICGWESDNDVTVDDGAFHIGDWEKHADELLLLGVITSKQYDDYRNGQEKQVVAAKETRRKEYERLKAEFESA